MLQQAMDIARMKRVHVFLVSLIGGIASVAFAAWFSVTLVAIYVSYEPSNSGSAANPSCTDGGCSSGKVIGLVVFTTFAGYWISEWLKNTIHTVVAGISVLGSQVVFPKEPQWAHSNEPPHIPSGQFHSAV
jgi:hypothetical protein